MIRIARFAAVIVALAALCFAAHAMQPAPTPPAPAPAQVAAQPPHQPCDAQHDGRDAVRPVRFVGLPPPLYTTLRTPTRAAPSPA